MSQYNLGNPAHTLSNDSENPGNAGPQSGSSYVDLKKRLLENGQLFEDPEFLPKDSNLFYSKSPPWPVEWKRPKELMDNPRFIEADGNRLDVRQGALGDCWMLASLSGLCQHKGLFEQVVVREQSFQNEYCGLFRFRFWMYGEWKEVVIDDRLPTFQNQLLFTDAGELFIWERFQPYSCR